MGKKKNECRKEKGIGRKQHHEHKKEKTTNKNEHKKEQTQKRNKNRTSTNKKQNFINSARKNYKLEGYRIFYEFNKEFKR